MLSPSSTFLATYSLYLWRASFICNRFWDQINTEDIAICEKVQLGTAAAPYQGGRFSFRFEETLHRFQNMLADKLVGEERIPEGDPPELWRW